LWSRPAGFATLVQLILEQQVSLSSGRAAFERLQLAVGRPTPADILRLDDGELLAIGFSRQKTRYVRALARAIEAGEFDPASLETLDDEAATATLLARTGIGPWTASVYLLMVLRRPDAWPVGDVALQAAAAEVKRLDGRPTPGELDRLGEPWRPWRSVAARILWHHYLRARGRG
jgi:DNA-3-methyladenine glycosylase II